MAKINKARLVSCLAVLLQGAAGAASVSWQSARAVADSTDVDTNGTLVLATYWSGVASTNLINSVTFKDTGTAATTQNGVTATLGGSYYGVRNNTFFAGHIPATLGAGPDGASYAALLGDGLWGGSASTLSLAGLTVGRQYRVQFWVYDDRSANGDTETISGSGSDANTPTMVLRNVFSPNNVPSYNCNGGSYVIGSFTASAATQIFTVTSASSSGIQLNAFQLRDVTGVTVPSPTPRSPAMAMGIAGTVGSAFSYPIGCFVNATNYSATNLPPGLSLNFGTGVISGTPSDQGIYHSTISGIVTGVTYQATLIFLISVGQGTPALSTSVPRCYFNNVPEATNYTLVYSLNLPWTGNYNTTPPPYAVDTHASVGPFTRVAYYLELQAPSGTLQYVWVSMNAFTTNAGQIGVPTTASGANFQQAVTNLNVVSDVAGTVTGTGLSGNLKFSPLNYGAMVISNSSAVFGFTNWGGGSGYAKIGITNYLAATNYSVRSLQVLVLNSDTNLTIQPVVDTSLLINPGKGYAEYWGPSQYTPAVTGVGFNRTSWSTMEPAEGVYDWSWVDNWIAVYAPYGRKFAFGVINCYGTPAWVFQPGTNAQTGTVYTNGAIPMTITNASGVNYLAPTSWDDPVYIKRTQEFIKALGLRYNGNSNIAYINMLDYGIWGEGNGSFGQGTMQASPDSTLTNYYQPYVQAFPNTLLIEDAWYGSVAASLVSQGTGAHTDGICNGTGNGDMDLFCYLHQPAIFEYYGAATNVYRGGPENELMIYLAGGRPSYLQFNGDLLYPTRTNFFNTVGNLIGYHFVLQQACIPKTIQSGIPFSFNWTWLNDGVAPLYEPCSVAVALLDTNYRLVQKQWLATCNPKSWMPGVSSTESFTNISFSSVPSGYKLAVGFFVNQTDSNPTYKLGLQGRTVTGWYPLTSIQSIGAIPPGSVTWQNAQCVAGSADVATNGSVVLATYFDTRKPGTYNVNGVAFTNNGTLTTTGGGVTAKLTGNWNVFEGTANGQTGNYGTILNGAAWGSAPQALALSGLTVGNQYLVQFWQVDGRGTSGKHTSISATGTDANPQTLTYYTATNTGAYVTGTFTAGAPTMVFTLNYASTEVDTAAFQLRDVTGVVLVANNPTNITASVYGNVLQLAWPTDHTGWRLLVQTNHVTTGVSSNTNDWATVPGADGVNQINITINPALSTEFYRLVYP